MKQRRGIEKQEVGGYVVNGQFFRTKKEVGERVQRILYTYPPETIVRDDEDITFLLALLTCHPQATLKIGSGIESFQVHENAFYGRRTRGFVLRRTDGTTDDFSYPKCITHPPALTVFKSVCRHLVWNQVLRFREYYYKKHQNEESRVQCPITGDWLARHEAHIDHASPITFDRLVNDFIALYHIDVETVSMHDMLGKTGEHIKVFDDEELIERWQQYHRSHAVLRIVSIKANLSILQRNVAA